MTLFKNFEKHTILSAFNTVEVEHQFTIISTDFLWRNIEIDVTKSSVRQFLVSKARILNDLECFMDAISNHLEFQF